MVGTTGSSGVEATVTGIVRGSGVENLATPKDQTAPPEALEGMVGPAIQPPSPQAVPPAAVEDDEVEEIEREEPQAQVVRILQKHSDDIVIVKEEDTTREFRRLETSLTRVMKQIKVSTMPRVLLFDVRNWISTLSLCMRRR